MTRVEMDLQRCVRLHPRRHAQGSAVPRTPPPDARLKSRPCAGAAPGPRALCAAAGAGAFARTRAPRARGSWARAGRHRVRPLAAHAGAGARPRTSSCSLSSTRGRSMRVVPVQKAVGQGCTVPSKGMSQPTLSAPPAQSVASAATTPLGCRGVVAALAFRGCSRALAAHLFQMRSTE